MKKYFLTFLVALFAAFSAQAVVLNWAISATETLGSGDDAITFNYSEVVAIAVYYQESDANWKLSSIPYDDLDTAVNSAQSSQWKEYSNSFGPTSASGTFDIYDETGYWYVVIFKQDGTYLQGTALSLSDKYFSPDDITPPASDVWDPAQTVEGIPQGTWGSTGLVPEPTSMALFALGIAAVGLRRRVKK